LAGKTGTTNDYTDAWFIGFSPSITCGVWMGFDEKKPLGENETGSRAALPIWIEFMRSAIADSSRRSEAFLRPIEEGKKAVLKRAAISLSRHTSDAEAH
jgi:penicillin-binding protein 1A